MPLKVRHWVLTTVAARHPPMLNSPKARPTASPHLSSFSFCHAEIGTQGARGRDQEVVNASHGDWLSGHSGRYSYGPGLLLYRMMNLILSGFIEVNYGEWPILLRGNYNRKVFLCLCRNQLNCPRYLGHKIRWERPGQGAWI
uniref:Uncharacterized protein n=1 Tax=Pipistrellus kuhlii TaxID=59472 RepID=A0A7J7ZL09_PIPKU|nr:hypothetical protein mPipKuh1_009619 [Pipistrellus kuhlii]